MSAAPVVTAHCDAHNCRSVDRNPAQPRIARYKLSDAFLVVALRNLQAFDSLPELKRRVVIVYAKFSSNDFAIDVVRGCFHLDQSDSKSHLVNVILSEAKNLGSNPTDHQRKETEMFESLASCFTFRCSALLNSPQDESAAADMTAPFVRWVLVEQVLAQQ